MQKGKEEEKKKKTCNFMCQNTQKLLRTTHRSAGILQVIDRFLKLHSFSSYLKITNNNVIRGWNGSHAKIIMNVIQFISYC